MNDMKKRIVIVDDSAKFRSIVKDFVIQFSELEVIAEATNGEDAIEIINLQQPDVVILDIKMPGISGVGVLKSIKISLKNTRIIILTNCSGQEYRKKCLELGATDFLDKSFEFFKLKDLLTISKSD
jgi:YesN/AraC family two-component response regulator